MPKRPNSFDFETTAKKLKREIIKEYEYYSIFKKANHQLGISKKSCSNKLSNLSNTLSITEKCSFCSTQFKEYTCQYCEKKLCNDCARICQKCIELFCKNCSFVHYGELETYVCYSCF